MKGRFCCFMLAFQIVSWVSAARRPFPPTDSISHSGQEVAPRPSPYASESKKGLKSMEGESEIMQKAYGRGASKIGSSPPNCEHKCYGCSPCEAIQVPCTSSRRSHFHIQYANYEPESWQCKCGPFFYSP